MMVLLERSWLLIPKAKSGGSGVCETKNSVGVRWGFGGGRDT